MKKLLLVLGLFLLCIFGGCESVDGNYYAENVTKVSDDKAIEATTGSAVINEGKMSSGLIISGEEAETASTDYFGTLEFVFRNPTEEWIRVKKIKLSFGNEEIDKNIFIPVGDDLYNWQKAYLKEIEINNVNRNRFLATTAFLSGAVSIAANNNKTRDVANVALITSIAATALNDINYSGKVEGIEKTIYPEDHLLAGNFGIPPGMFVNKFIVINSKNNSKIGYLYQVKITVEMENGTTDTFILPFRKNPYKGRGEITNKSNWQKDVLREVNLKIRNQ